MSSDRDWFSECMNAPIENDSTQGDSNEVSRKKGNTKTHGNGSKGKRGNGTKTWLPRW